MNASVQTNSLGGSNLMPADGGLVMTLLRQTQEQQQLIAQLQSQLHQRLQTNQMDISQDVPRVQPGTGQSISPTQDCLQHSGHFETTEELQGISRILFDSLPPSPSSSSEIDFDQDVDLWMQIPLNVQNPTPAAMKRSMDEGEQQIENSARKKRARNPLTLQMRLDIIKFKDDHPGWSVIKISEKFNIPRTTVHGILKRRGRFEQDINGCPHGGLSSERYSRAESPFRILELLLVDWLLDLKSQGILGDSNKNTILGIDRNMVTAQAFEMHRMLSGLSTPLVPCEFSTGWFDKFQKRRACLLTCRINNNNTALQDDNWIFPETHATRFSGYLEDVYTCGLTSMFMNKIPTTAYVGSGQDPAIDTQDALIASVLLCCNASGTDHRPLHILVRHSQSIIETEDSYGKPVSSGAEDLTVSELEGWLKDFDKTLDHTILLIMDPSVWEPYTRIKDVNKRWKFIRIVKVPRINNQSLPMAAGIVREFRRRYFWLVLSEGMRDRPNGYETNLEVYLGFLTLAWSDVRRPTIVSSFEKVLGLIKEQLLRCQRGQPPQRPPETGYRSQRYLPPMFKAATFRSRQVDLDEDFPVVVKRALPHVPTAVRQYYLTQDSSIGPSRFLWAKIQEMQRHDDFKDCFGTPSFGQVRHYSYMDVLGLAGSPVRSYIH